MTNISKRFYFEQENNSQRSVLSRRVIHDPNQITDPSQFKEGKKYQQRGNIEGKTIKSYFPFEFIGFHDDEWILVKKFDYSGNRSSINNTRSLADMGVIPYKNSDGKKVWNATNYVIPLESD